MFIYLPKWLFPTNAVLIRVPRKREYFQFQFPIIGINKMEDLNTMEIRTRVGAERNEN